MSKTRPVSRAALKRLLAKWDAYVKAHRLTATDILGLFAAEGWITYSMIESDDIKTARPI